MGAAEALHYFDRIYVINLPSRVDRKREMAEQLARVGLSLASPLVEVFEAARPQDSGGFRTIGARGCYMSHLGVLKSAKDAAYSRILIFEDDLNFASHFDEAMPSVANYLTETEWDIFYGGYTIKDSSKLSNGINVIRPELTVGCTHFMGFQLRAINMAIKHLETMLSRKAGDPEGGPMDVDGAYNWLRRLNPQLRTLLAFPELGYQRASRTDIADLRWFDRMRGIRESIAAARRMRRLFRN